MANILLVSPTNEIHAERQNWSSPHLGIWRVAGWLMKYGHNVDVWDTILEDKRIPPVECGHGTGFEKGYDVIGFSLTHDTLADDIWLMRKLGDSFPGAVLVAGGVEASTNFQQILERVPRLSHVVIGEGERAMKEIADNQTSRTCVVGHLAAPGVTRRHQYIRQRTFTDFNFAMPFDRMRHRDHWAITRRLRPRTEAREIHCVRLNTSTYCDRACKFCSLKHIHNLAAGHICKPMTMSSRAKQELVRKVLKALPETQTIYLNDDDFCVEYQTAGEFFEDPPKLDYHIQARPDTVDKDLLKHMARGGCKRVSFGVEAVVNDVLRETGKGITIEQSEQAIEWCVEAGIDPVILVMIFCPSMTMDDLVVTWKKLKSWEERGFLLTIMSYIRAYHGSWYLESGMHEISWQRRVSAKKPYVTLKQPHAVLLDDPDVRELWYEFETRLADRESRMHDHWKGIVSNVMVEVLGDLLKERGAL